MVRRIHFFDPPQRFVAGNCRASRAADVLPAGPRLGHITRVALEKVQVQLLAEKIDQMLDDLVDDGTAGVDIPTAPAEVEPDSDPLDQPLVEEFRVGNLRLGWHESPHGRDRGVQLRRPGTRSRRRRRSPGRV